MDPGNTPVKIIIVDDCAHDQFFLKTALGHFKNIRFESFYYPEKFIEHITSLDKDELPDIVIIDINMPRLTGFEVIESIRNRDTTHKTSFFIVSSSITEKDKQHCERLKLDCYTKPYSIGQFKSLVAEIIERWKLERV